MCAAKLAPGEKVPQPRPLWGNSAGRTQARMLMFLGLGSLNNPSALYSDAWVRVSIISSDNLWL